MAANKNCDRAARRACTSATSVGVNVHEAALTLLRT
jgi:hypothetical protein